MPEYSSTTLTPTNETKVPAMQNNSSGNFQLDALKAYILAEKAQANGLASLDATGKLVSSQIPDNLDDVLVYGSYALLPATGVEGKIYITADTNSMYRWDASLETPDYVMLAVDLEEYATKAELQAETNQRKASDSRLEARLENLEQVAGDYGTWHYPNDPNHSSDMPNKVPTGKAKNGLVEKIVGKSRAWNQFIVSPRLQGSLSTGSHHFNGIKWKNGRKYLMVVYGLPANCFVQTDGQYPMQKMTSDGAKIFTAPASFTDSPYFYNNSGASVTVDGYVIIRDVSLILSDWADADITTANIPLMVKQVPDLLKPDAYDAGSLVDTEVSGVKSVGVNIWDEEWEVGTLTSSGKDYADNIHHRTVGYISILPNTEYYFKAPSSLTIHFYDINKDWISSTSAYNTNKTTPSNAYYMRFRWTPTTVGKYDSDIQVCLNSYADKTVYHPYKSDTLSLSETVTLKSAGTVADELDVESGVVTRRIGVVDMGTLDLLYTTNTENVPIFYADISGFSGIANLLCELYVLVGQSRNAITNDREMSAWNSSYLARIAFSDSRYTDADLVNGKAPWLEGVILNYELATPTTESIDPIIDNFIEVEGGGTVETIQTQTPVIDNCLDVGYLTV